MRLFGHQTRLHLGRIGTALTRFRSVRSAAGDTVVEVLIGIALLGAAISAGVITSNHNLQLSVDSANRNQANTIAQAQIEHIRNAYTTGSTQLDIFKSQPGDFCILDNSTVAATAAANTPCNRFNGSDLNISVSYSGTTFTVNISWSTPTNGTGANNVTLYYKLPGGFLQPGAPTNLTSPGQTPSSIDLVWQAPTNSTNIVSYDIFRSGGLNPQPFKIANVSGTSYTDAGLIAATSYSYYVKAIDTFGNVSNPSNILSISTKPLPTPTANLVASPTQMGLCFSPNGNPGSCPATDTCISVNEPSEPAAYTFNDDYLCWPASHNLGISFVSNGPINAGITTIGGKTCVNTFEGSDPNTWWDNYICAPRDYGLRWSSSGSIGNMSCTRWLETSAPGGYTWTNNYLCEPNYSSADLNWTSTNSTSCSSSWGGGGNGTSGSDFVFGLTSPTTYKVTCTGPNPPPDTDSQTVSPGTIVAQSACTGSYCGAPPTASLTASPNPVAYNNSTNLTWSSTGATSCTGSGFSTGSGSPASGSVNTAALTSNTTFRVDCSGPGGTISASVSVTVGPAPAPTISGFGFSPSTMNRGSTSTLSWTIGGLASSCNISGNWAGPVSASAGYNGFSVSPGVGDYSSSIACSGPGGSAGPYSASLRVNLEPYTGDCYATAGGWRVGNFVWITAGGGGGCGYWQDDVGGWNGTGATYGPYNSPGQFCHTQRGGIDPWGMVSAASWCG